MGSTNFHEVEYTWPKWVLAYTSDFLSVPGPCRDVSGVRICPRVRLPQLMSQYEMLFGSLAFLPCRFSPLLF